MKLSSLGEFGLIDRLTQTLAHRSAPGVVGIGDDCAVIPCGAGQATLVTTDMLVEDVHFLRDAIAPRDLGYKALAVNLSDIAAMGGKPTYSFLSLALPANTEVAWVDAFFEGYNEISSQFGAQLLGGDTTRSAGPIAISVTAMGEAKASQIKLRSGAVPGDIIFVTGDLGDSGGGLRALLEQRASDGDVDYLIARHHRPTPHVAQGQWLARSEFVHAMMDVSDGVASDLRHIVTSSHCGATVNVATLPISPVLKRAAHKFDWDPTALALTAGEDYCLLLTVDAAHAPALQADYQRAFGDALHTVGVITSNAGQLSYVDGERPYAPPSSGFEHFRAPNPVS